MDIEVDLNRAALLTVSLGDVHAYPVVALHIDKVLTGAESVIGNGVHYDPVVSGIFSALSGVDLDSVCGGFVAALLIVADAVV